jgi:FlaA1/EpsC-like NDP-sugar epimerase
MADGVVGWLLGLPRAQKRLLAIAMDSALCLWSAWAAFYLRLGIWVWPQGGQWLALVASVAIAIPLFVRGGLYNSILRHAGSPVLLLLVRAWLIYGAIFALIFTFISIDAIPRTVGLIQPVLLLVSIAASRAAAYYLLSGNFRRPSPNAAIPRVLIYGAGQSGRQLARALRNRNEMRTIGFFDDDKSLHRGTLEGMPVYDPADALDVVRNLEATDVLLAIPSATRQRRRRIVELLRDSGVNIRILPGLVDLARGELHISDIRPLQVEDLLGREPVHPNPELLRQDITSKVVMVTGGGGSIGSELCRQIHDLGPTALIIVESSEFALYSIHRELVTHRRGGDTVQVVPLLASALDEDRIGAILRTYKPDTIYHAAAYKHVPLVECNFLEGLRNNVFGTFSTARLAAEYAVPKFVLVSTDKAVRPTNLMGASKRVSELAVQALAATFDTTCFAIVRFGNVLGSSGSVVPLFREQIAAGGPITITHAEVTRYFMTIPEAAQLVVQAGAMAQGGEVFVLDMGEPVLIRDLALNMVQLSGLTVRDTRHPDGDIVIEEIGLRPGEKLYEELLIGENPRGTVHERIIHAREHFLPLEDLEPKLRRLRALIAEDDVDSALVLLKDLVPEYRSAIMMADQITSEASEPRIPSEALQYPDAERRI